jgi:hypothetical protein
MVPIWLSRAQGSAGHRGVQGTGECRAQGVQGTGSAGHRECRAQGVHLVPDKVPDLVGEHTGHISARYEDSTVILGAAFRRAGITGVRASLR